METNPNDYHISFFKPTTPIARYNRNLVVWLVSIWVVAIFGFQILLKVVGKPTPEQAYVQYEQVWPKITGNQAQMADLQTFAHNCLSVLGKNFITAQEKSTLDQALSWTLFQLTPDEYRMTLLADIQQFESLKASITDITDAGYVEAKNKLADLVSPILGLDEADIRTQLVATELSSEGWGEFAAADQAALPDIMSKYLIHNESFLTKAKVLGFPFHYFYTAFFLLILFVGLCLLYCVRIDRRNIVLGIPE